MTYTQYKEQEKQKMKKKNQKTKDKELKNEEVKTEELTKEDLKKDFLDYVCWRTAMLIDSRFDSNLDSYGAIITGWCEMNTMKNPEQYTKAWQKMDEIWDSLNVDTYTMDTLTNKNPGIVDELIQERKIFQGLSSTFVRGWSDFSYVPCWSELTKHPISWWLSFQETDFSPRLKKFLESNIPYLAGKNLQRYKLICRFYKEFEELLDKPGVHHHHVKPKSIYPSLKDDPFNIVALPPIVHAAAHYFLAEYAKYSGDQRFKNMHFADVVGFINSKSTNGRTLTFTPAAAENIINAVVDACAKYWQLRPVRKDEPEKIDKQEKIDKILRTLNNEIDRIYTDCESVDILDYEPLSRIVTWLNDHCHLIVRDSSLEIKWADQERDTRVNDLNVDLNVDLKQASDDLNSIF